MVGLAPAEIKVFAGALQNGLSRITNPRQAILQTTMAWIYKQPTTTMALQTTNNNHGADLQSVTWFNRLFVPLFCNE